MTPDSVRSAYRRALGQFETVIMRRYFGTHPSQTREDFVVQARVTECTAEELVGFIVQGDRKLSIMHEDLVNASYPLPIPIGQNSKVLVGTKELIIKSADPNTRRINGETIAHDIVAGG